MNKFGLVFGLAAVATLAGCKDPDYNHAPAGGAQNAPVNVDTTPTPVATTVPTAVTPAPAKCTCPPGMKHTSPCTCGDPDCKCIVETKSLPTPPVAAAPEYTVYIVQNGDYLAKISKKFNVTITSIKRLNPSIKKDIVWVGQKLKIPGKVDVGVQTVPPVASVKASSGRKASSSVYTGAVKEYVVKNGDTLGSVAYGNGINIRQLKALNGLTSDSLKIGQKLKIPAEKVTKQTKAKSAVKTAAPAPAKPAEAAPAAPATPATPALAAPATPAPAAADTNAVATAASAAATEAPKPAAPATTTYTVQEGDDMTGVSIRWAVSAAEIRELNNMAEGDQLKPGMTIKLPAEAVQQ